MSRVADQSKAPYSGRFMPTKSDIVWTGFFSSVWKGFHDEDDEDDWAGALLDDAHP
jgi:hypothetical protein